MRRLLALLLLFCPLLCVAQTASRSITVVRQDGSSLVLSSDSLATLPRVAAQFTVHGKTSTVEGPELRAVLQMAAVSPLDSLRGPSMRRVVSVVAADGYRVVIPLSDLDPSIGALQVLLVDRENGAPLASTDGPWRLAIPSDHRPARAARMVTRLEITDV